MKLKQLSAYLSQLLPENGVKDYCPNGLQIEGKQEVAQIATAVSANVETIEAAIEKGIDALIVHHGLFWQNESYSIIGSKRKKIALLLNHEISLFAYHLPLDMHPDLGNNWKAAKDLKWADLHPFGYLNGIPIGVAGRVPSTSRIEFQKQLESYYQHPATCAWGEKELIETVALVSGGAHKTLVDAGKEGIDAFVTGSFDEPTWYQAKEENINFFALGHSATERIGPLALASYLQATLQIPCRFLDIHNPF